MYEVIICTIGSGRVQRKLFESWDEAKACADHWQTKGVKAPHFRLCYRVEMTRRELPAVRTAHRPSQPSAAA